MSRTDEAIARIRTLVQSTDNEALTTVIDGISSSTLRARVWRGMVEADATDRTLAEHEAIYAALADGDATLAQAAALMHISTTERWLRRVHGAGHAGSGDEPDEPAGS